MYIDVNFTVCLYFSQFPWITWHLETRKVGVRSQGKDILKHTKQFVHSEWCIQGNCALPDVSPEYIVDKTNHDWLLIHLFVCFVPLLHSSSVWQWWMLNAWKLIWVTFDVQWTTFYPDNSSSSMRWKMGYTAIVNMTLSEGLFYPV